MSVISSIGYFLVEAARAETTQFATAAAVVKAFAKLHIDEAVRVADRVRLAGGLLSSVGVASNACNSRTIRQGKSTWPMPCCSFGAVSSSSVVVSSTVVPAELESTLGDGTLGDESAASCMMGCSVADGLGEVAAFLDA